MEMLKVLLKLTTDTFWLKIKAYSKGYTVKCRWNEIINMMEKGFGSELVYN